MNAHSGAGFDTPEPFSVNNSYGTSGTAYRPGPRPRRHIGGLWIFMLSCLPGLNYMAMGLIKRGLFFMSAFFGIIFLMSTMHSLVFPLTILFFASMFDSQSKRRRINNGEYVPDDIDDIIRFVKKYKTLLIAAATFLILVKMFHLVVVVLLCILIWYFIKNRTTKSDNNNSNN